MDARQVTNWRPCPLVGRTSSAEATSGSLVLRRTCGCGSPKGLAGECEECRSRKLLGKRIRPKLRVSEPGDEYEREADRVAVHMMQTPDSVPQPTHSSHVDRVVRRQAGAPSTGLHPDLPGHVSEVLSSVGRPLDAESRAFFEPLFGFDFGRVRVHADAKAHTSARALDARAYTVESDIAFGAGEYQPQTTVGRRLLAHELTHVAQHALHRPSPAIIHRAPLGGAQTADVTSERFLNAAMDFLEDFREFRARLAALRPPASSGMYNLNVALTQFDQQWRSMEGHQRFTATDFYGLFMYARQALGSFPPVIADAAAGVRTESDVSNLADVRRRLADLNAQLDRLQGTRSIVEKGKEQEQPHEANAEAAQERLALEAAWRGTPEGRREDALEFTRGFVRNERRWWPGRRRRPPPCSAASWGLITCTRSI